MSFLRSASPTQKDIAKALGFAQSTVASALNPKYQYKLPKETIELIQNKARELNYQPQRQARFLRTGRSHTIGAVLFHSTYHAPMERVRALARTTIAAGYQLAVVDAAWFDNGASNFVESAEQHLVDHAVEGVVFCNPRFDHRDGWRDVIQRRGLPGVVIGNRGILEDETDVNLEPVFYEMTRHHLAQGSRNLHLVLPFHDGSLKALQPEAFAGAWSGGFIRAIREAGGEVITDENNARLMNLPTTFSSGKAALRAKIHFPLKTALFSDVMDVGYHVVRELLRSDKIDSVICSNDHVAAGAVTACIEAGVKVPREVLVSGGDNTLFSRYCGVPLTTTDHPIQEQAEWSIRRIIELIENPAERKKPQSRHYPCKLVIRKSTLRDS